MKVLNMQKNASLILIKYFEVTLIAVSKIRLKPWDINISQPTPLGEMEKQIIIFYLYTSPLQCIC